METGIEGRQNISTDIVYLLKKEVRKFTVHLITQQSFRREIALRNAISVHS